MDDRDEKAPPRLALTKEGQAFHPPEEASHWKVFNHDRLAGRPSIVWINKGPLLLDLDADMDEFRRAVKNLMDPLIRVGTSPFNIILSAYRMTNRHFL